MDTRATDADFIGSVPEVYERHMVPLLFAPYAADLAARAARYRPASVLELAAGTGVLTRELARALPAEVPIVATDLNQPMLDRAAAVGTARPVGWQQADAQRLPFPDAAFDLVVCQFGVMFFPDKAGAYAEARRVLRPGGHLLFSVWDRLAENSVSATVDAALRGLFPDNPSTFMARTPHGYYDPATIARDLAAGGFVVAPAIVPLPLQSRAASPRSAAVALCQGTPMRGEILARDPARLAEATDTAERALAQRFGSGAIEGPMQALIVAAER